MLNRPRVTKLLLVLYAFGSVALAVPLLIYGRAGELSQTTSGRILAAALLAMGLGALGAARDPWGNRLLIKVLIAFAGLSSLAIIHRLAAGNHEPDPAWLLLPFAVAASILLGVFYPRPPRG
jgi:xanthine/uracil permease